MSVSSSSSPLNRFRDALPSVVKKSRHSEIWGFSLEQAESRVLELVLEKFLKKHSAIPALQVCRAKASLEKTLEWRRLADPGSLLAEAESILPDLNLCHITLNEGQYVLWVRIDEMVIKGNFPLHQNLKTSQGLVDLGLAAMEKLSMVLLHAAASSDLHDDTAACVVEFKPHNIQNNKKQHLSFQQKIQNALEELVVLLRHHYPNILGKAYIINPQEEYLAHLDIDEGLLSDAILLDSPEDLAPYLGSQIPPQYGGNGKSFGKSDLLYRGHFERNPGNFDSPEPSSASDNKTEDTKPQNEPSTPAMNIGFTCPEGREPEEQKPNEPEPRLIYSEVIGPPSIILDPGDLQTAEDLCPDKMGARIVFADSDTVVKFGHGVHLGEAEALHLASTRTNIATPQLLSAYILDGVTYIVMSYEVGEPLAQYWDRVSKSEQNGVLEQLRGYVNQMRNIPGDFIGSLDRTPCRDGIFEAGYGDYTQYSYGPYESEESFNEGLVQALRDRFAPKVLEREDDMESNFFNSEYMLYQTVRGLKNHKIVFTHADLHPGNIIVRTDGTIVLLDWGLAGFWPDYWEFYRAMFNGPWRASWDRMVEKFIPPSYVEYSVMKRVFATAWN